MGQSKKHRFVVKQMIPNSRHQESSETDDDGFVQLHATSKPRNHRRVRRQRSSRQNVALRRNKDAFRSPTSYKTPTQSDGNISHCSNCQEIDDESSSHQQHRKKNVKITVRPMKQKGVERRILSDTCHKGMEARGYHPVTEADLCSKNKTNSACESAKEDLPCREHIYRPVRELNRKCNDDFISKLENRRERDKKLGSELDNRQNCVDTDNQLDRQREECNFSNTRDNNDKYCKERQKMQNYEVDECDHKKFCRRHEIKVIPTCKKGLSDFKFITREEKPEGCEEHLFPFQKTAVGLLKIDPSMICYQDGKMCLLVADHSKVRVQYKSTLLFSDKVAKPKVNDCEGNEQLPSTKHPKRYSRTPSPVKCQVDDRNDEIPVKDCHPIRQRYENVRRRL